jgi:hypothetical protein
MPQKRIPTIVRYFSKVDQSAGPDECWPWTGAKDQDGYGIFWDGTYRDSGAGHYVRVTRWTYEQFVGPVGTCHLLHRCDNPPCVNVAHLFLGTNAENMADREAKGRGGQRQTRGELHVNHKLTAEHVRAIRSRRADGETALALAGEYGVSDALIYKIVKRQIWTHLE